MCTIRLTVNPCVCMLLAFRFLSRPQLQAWDLQRRVLRFLRTALEEDDFVKQSEFTCRKLIDGGYDRVASRKILTAFPGQSKQQRMAAKPEKEAAGTFRCSRIGRTFSKQGEILPEHFEKGHGLVVCYTSNKNFFRLRYFRLCESFDS